MSERFRVVGGARLHGSVTVVGAKNSALKLMAGALLAVGRTRLTNVPGIVDVTIMAELLRRLGAAVDWDPATGVVEIDVPERIGHRADYQLVRALRASICVLGPLVARVGEADVAVPGGDAIGSRGLDLHAEGLEALGAKVHVAHGYLIAAAPQGLHGADIRLEFPSVGATENVLMAAVLAPGHTRIDNAAREPEIVDIAAFLVAMGAQVTGAGTSTIEIEGVEALRPTEHTVVPDRVAAGSWAFAAATTGGDVEVVGGIAAHLQLALDLLSGAGASVTTTESGFRVVGAPYRPRSIDVATLPYPGFPTDLQPFAITYDAVADGSAMVTENLFEARFRTVQELARLGADARIDGHHVMVHGVPQLSGAPVEASDIRAGAALVLAGLVADGVTTVSGAHHVDRGYDQFELQMQALGAEVTREPDDELYG
ncbi:UDP-N-acetylglucosamine 1-carboxyvinyltransferase [Lapillicoccus sp.]|uniref:UDP-N-acetylglucosamine 1-carboxyvinyltransferase n=1 Tax=Lapillicoccus sp. TaxID=1909287 RepID=UPI0027CD33B8|nr:UDP-N-acetylglucosamine 1-carboxyvinyltransferase [Actinomycetota bacterium]